MPETVNSQLPMAEEVMDLRGDSTTAISLIGIISNSIMNTYFIATSQGSYSQHKKARLASDGDITEIHNWSNEEDKRLWGNWLQLKHI